MLSKLIFLSLIAVSFPAQAQQDGSSNVPMKCATGPVNRTFGGTEWIVYSCDDQVSMVVLSIPGNPASPFYFFLKPEAGTYRLLGEGTGDKKASDAARDDLSKFTVADFTALLAATKAAKRRQ